MITTRLPLASVAVIVNEKEHEGCVQVAGAMVPDNTPEVLSAIPEGNPTADQVYGGTPPDAVRVAVYSTLTNAEGRLVVVIAKADATFRVSVTDATLPTESVTENVAGKLHVPLGQDDAATVPDKIPVVLRDSPLGRPAPTVQV